MSEPREWVRALCRLGVLATALFILNAALTFHNRWPTVGIRLAPELSWELAVLLLCLALGIAWRGPPGPRLRRWIVAGYGFFVLCRYLDVTAPGLMGRPINLYWDGPHIPAVVAMLVDGVPVWQLVIGVLGLTLLIVLLMFVLNWALGVVLAALTETPARRLLGVVAAGALTLFAIGLSSARLSTEHWFSLPVSGMLAEQTDFFLKASLSRDSARFRTSKEPPESDLSRLAGADVFVFFYESYGAVLFDRPDYAKALAGDFAALERKLTDQGWRIASTRVDSTTFGGASWLAHSSFLSGLRIEDQGDYQLLLTTDRANLVDRFRGAGYRCVALMPGLKKSWPEGRYYGFDRIYTATELKYSGPSFGWWTIPDQFSLYRLHQEEVRAAPRAPVLVFFTSITSHAPFAPVPPYVPYWRTLTTSASYPDTTLESGAGSAGALGDLAPSYIATIRYNLRLLDGYLSEHAPDDALFLVLGDHQPPALVSGQGVSWQVPAHILSRDETLINAFLEVGFKPGLVPDRRVIGSIETLNPLILELLDSRAADRLTVSREQLQVTDLRPSEPAPQPTRAIPPTGRQSQ